MAHEVETMMYVRKTPWHGLGVKLDAPPTIAEALIKAGLDWTVSLKRLQTEDGVKVDAYATIRSSDGTVLGTVGPGYHPVQNAGALNFFDPFLSAGAASLEAAGSLRKGARVWVLAKIGKPDSVINAKSDDRVAKYLLLAHGHDGHMTIRIIVTPTRVVCMNTLCAALNGAHHLNIRIPHTSGAEKALAAVRDTIERADNDFEKAADVFRALSMVQVNTEKLRAYVNAIWPKKETAKEKVATGAELLAPLLARPVAERDRTDALVERMMAKGESKVLEDVTRLFETGRGAELAGTKGTAWGAYNAVTEYLTWEAGRTDDNRMNSLWFQSAKPAQAIQAAQQVFLNG
jgi:phage/plasmid-like protein (TIGR03299 family)